MTASKPRLGQVLTVSMSGCLLRLRVVLVADTSLYLWRKP